MPLRMLALLLILSPVLAVAQQTHRTPIVFTCQCDDPVSDAFATAFRDQLATSPRYIQGYKAEEKDAHGKVTSMLWKVSVIGAADGSHQLGASTVVDSMAASVVLTIGDDVFMTHEVMQCGREKTRECAASLLTFVDKAVQ